MLPQYNGCVEATVCMLCVFLRDRQAVLRDISSLNVVSGNMPCPSQRTSRRNDAARKRHRHLHPSGCIARYFSSTGMGGPLPRTRLPHQYSRSLVDLCCSVRLHLHFVRAISRPTSTFVIYIFVVCHDRIDACVHTVVMKA